MGSLFEFTNATKKVFAVFGGIAAIVGGMITLEWPIFAAVMVIMTVLTIYVALTPILPAWVRTPEMSFAIVAVAVIVGTVTAWFAKRTAPFDDMPNASIVKYDSDAALSKVVVGPPKAPNATERADAKKMPKIQTQPDPTDSAYNVTLGGPEFYVCNPDKSVHNTIQAVSTLIRRWTKPDGRSLCEFSCDNSSRLYVVACEDSSD